MARLFDDGNSEYLEVAQAPATGLPLTLAAWVRTDDLATSQCALSIADSGTTNNFVEIWFQQSDDTARLTTSNSSGLAAAISTASLSANTWHHICGAAQSGNNYIWLDGGNKGSTSYNYAPASLNRTAIGRLCDSTPSLYWSGGIAEAAIWDVVLTDAEVAMLARGYSPLFVRPQNLVAYWPLIRDEDQDRVGGYDMAAYNTPSVAAHPPIIYSAQLHIPAPASIDLGGGQMTLMRGYWGP